MEIRPEHSLEGLMLKLKLQSFGHLMQRADSLENTLMVGKIEGRRRRGRQRMRWMASLTWWTWVSARSGSWWWTGKPGVLSPWGRKESDTTEWLNCRASQRQLHSVKVRGINTLAFPSLWSPNGMPHWLNPTEGPRARSPWMKPMEVNLSDFGGEGRV